MNSLDQKRLYSGGDHFYLDRMLVGVFTVNLSRQHWYRVETVASEAICDLMPRLKN